MRGVADNRRGVKAKVPVVSISGSFADCLFDGVFDENDEAIDKVLCEWRAWGRICVSEGQAWAIYAACTVWTVIHNSEENTDDRR